VTVEPAESVTTVSIPGWGIAARSDVGDTHGVFAAVALILEQLGLTSAHFSIHVDTRLPRGMGLGSSAAVAVALTRAVSDAMDLNIDDKRINAIAFECEKLAHGTPSGVDNTLATFAEPMLFCKDSTPQIEPLRLTEFPPILIASGDETGLTSDQVAGVRARRERAPERYDAIFDEIDRISLAGVELLRSQSYGELGLAMNVCHGLLNAIEVSTPGLERMVTLARGAGAVGAKLTGGGGGGSIIALCPGTMDSVQRALRQAGYRTLVLDR
jgi:hydroxymethylglutaryl-CoA reductase